MRITRPRATSLSQIRINADLDMGALYNIILGAGQTVDGRDVSEIEAGAQKNVWQLIDSYVDTNTGTIFSYDSGTFTTYDFLKIIFHVSEQATAPNDLDFRLNNESGGIYDFERFYSPDTVSSITGATAFSVGSLPSTRAMVGEILIRGRAAAAAGSPGIAHLSARIGGAVGEHKLINGHADLTASTVTRATLYSSGNATGHLLLYGSNI